MRGLLVKSIRETWLATLLFGAALFLFESIIGYVMPTFLNEEAARWLEVEFVQMMLKAILGSEVAGGLVTDAAGAIAWVHPMVLYLLFAHLMVICTRVPVGEIDRGTIDILLGLPVSRVALHVSELLVCLASGIVLLAMGCAGNMVGQLFVGPAAGTDPGGLAAVLVNLYALYIAVAGVAMLISALTTRRLYAVLLIFIVVEAWFLLSYLAPFWKPAEMVAFLSAMRYYQPFVILRSEGWPIGDIAVLTVFGAVMSGIGAVVFARRDLSAV